MKLIGKLEKVYKNEKTGKLELCFEVENLKYILEESINKLADFEKIDIEIKKHRKKRSLDANAYAWVLINKLSEKTGYSPKTIYRQAIQDIGGASDIVCVVETAKKRLIRNWQRKGIGWMTTVMPSKLPNCVTIILYYGSSVYDSKQMSTLIDILVDACKEQGIETDTPEQIAKLKSLWREKGKNDG